MRKVDSFVRVYGEQVGRTKLRLRQQISNTCSWLSKLRKKLQCEPEHRVSIESRMRQAEVRLATLRSVLALEN
jgi:hypothetical protein